MVTSNVTNKCLFYSYRYISTLWNSLFLSWSWLESIKYNNRRHLEFGILWNSTISSEATYVGGNIMHCKISLGVVSSHDILLHKTNNKVCATCHVNYNTLALMCFICNMNFTRSLNDHWNLEHLVVEYVEIVPLHFTRVLEGFKRQLK